MQNERAGHTLTPTDVVHEAMARLLANESRSAAQDPVHVFAQAARAMNHVLIDHARRRRAQKRGGAAKRLDLDDIDASLFASSRDWMALDEALEEMQRTDSRRHAVVVMKFFGGLDNRQIAAELMVDERTVGRDWNGARIWLSKRLADAESTGDKK
jgi:RNA polymerase sigma factor (TIGR02999 family)